MKASSILGCVCVVMMMINGYNTIGDGHIETIDKLSIENVKKWMDDTNDTLIVHLYNGTCQADCEYSKKVLQKNAGEYLSVDSTIQIYSADFGHLEAIHEYIHLDDDTSTLGIFRGEAFRLDRPTSSNTTVRDLHRDILDFLQKKVIELSTEEEARKLLASGKNFHIFYGETTLKFYSNIEIAIKSVETHLYRTESKEIAKIFGIKTKNYIYAYYQDLNTTLQMKSYPSYHKIELFLNASMEPVPRQFTPEDVGLSLAGGFPVLIVRASSPAGAKRIFKQFHAVEDLIRNSFHVYDVTGQPEEILKGYDEDCRKEGSQRTNYICILRERDEEIEKYIYQNIELNEAGISKMIVKYTTNALKPYFKTEVIPKTERESPLRSLNTKTFDKFLDSKNDKDSAVRFVYYYKNDCLECEKFIDVLKVYAETVNKDEGIFAKVNLDRNEIEFVEDVNVPSLVAYQAYEHADPDLLEGEHNHDNLKNLVEKALEKRKNILEEIATKEQDL